MSSMAQRRLAQSVVRGNLPPGIPRVPHPVFHFGSVAAVDLGRHVVSHLWNEPGDPITDGVPWFEYYTTDRPPSTSDLTFGVQWDKDKFALMGRLVVPDSAVILG